MPQKKNTPQGVMLSDTPCGGPHTTAAKDRKCPHGSMLKLKIAEVHGDNGRCYRCFRTDHPSMNAQEGHRGIYSGGERKIGSKGGTRRKGRKKSTSASA